MLMVRAGRVFTHSTGLLFYGTTKAWRAIYCNQKRSGADGPRLG